jgi:putative copper resistance protein D
LSLDWNTVLTDWQRDALALVGLTLEVLTAVAYVVGARRLRASGRRWPSGRTVSFLLGVLCLAFALQSGFATYDEDLLWVHMSQHLLLMMVAAPLLAWGAPVRLWLAAGTPPMRRFAAGVLHDPGMRLVAGRKAAVLVPLDYYGSMALIALTPLFRLTETSPWFHEFVHIYFLACGLMFWVPILGQDPAAWRPAYRLKIALVALGIPVYAAIAWGMWAEGVYVSPEHSLSDIHLGAAVMIVGGVTLSLAGVAALMIVERRRRHLVIERSSMRQPGLAVAA